VNVLERTHEGLGSPFLVESEAACLAPDSLREGSLSQSVLRSCNRACGDMIGCVARVFRYLAASPCSACCRLATRALWAAITFSGSS